jgi:branched-chain amino acid transport system permease protein
VVAFSLNAMLCGLAGGVYAYWHSTIDPPTVFDLTTNVRLIVMAVLGGAGTPLGPILGAAVLTGIQETLWKNFTNLHAVLFGASIVVVVMLMPRGIVYLIRQKFSWRVFARNLRQYRV